jgi:hypothetical protein
MENVRDLGNSEKQEGLIRAYCAEAEKLLAGATGYASAVRLKESLCERFQKECDSTLVATAIRMHLEGVLKTRWGVSEHGGDTTVDRD